MGNIPSSAKVNFEEMQSLILNSNSEHWTLISVLRDSDQHCLIMTTVGANREEDVINELMKKNKKRLIVIYGMNCNDEKIIKKYKQISSYGFTNVKVYIGGLFEWLCLQDIYDSEKFPTDGEELDLLNYK